MKKTEFYQSQLGKIKKVIPEDYNNKTRLYKGWSENYVRAAFYNKNELYGQVLEVKLLNIQDDIIFSELLIP